MDADEEFAPDPKKVTVVGGVIFNPWVNIAASLLCTIGVGWLTVWFWSLWQETKSAPAYEDQGLDLAGTLIGAGFGALATLILFGTTIWVVRWWAKRGWTLS